MFNFNAGGVRYCLSWRVVSGRGRQKNPNPNPKPRLRKNESQSQSQSQKGGSFSLNLQNSDFFMKFGPNKTLNKQLIISLLRTFLLNYQEDILFVLPERALNKH